MSAPDTTGAGVMDIPLAPLFIEDIEALLPHRYPFLLVDRVLEMEAPQRIVALKNVTANEPFFQGHFPGKKVMPGVLIIEALAQAAAIMTLGLPEKRGWLAFLVGVDNAKFRRPVVPGDTLRLEVSLTKLRGRYGAVSGQALVGDELVASADIKFAFKGQVES